MPERTLVDCDFPQELQVVGDREAHSGLSCERHLRWCQELRWSSNQSLSARKHWSINSNSPASPWLSVVTGDRDPEGDPEGEALASMLKRTGRRDRYLLKLTWTKMSERKVQKSDHQLPFLIELATQFNFFFFGAKQKIRWPPHTDWPPYKTGLIRILGMDISYEKARATYEHFQA